MNILKTFSVYFQYLLPKHLISIIVGRIANSKKKYIKNLFIKSFIKLYSVKMAEAVQKDPERYDSFNDFFTREIDFSKRHRIFDDQALVSPVDGEIAQIGTIHRNTLVKAKDFYFNLEALLANDANLAPTFDGGSFITLYLAPHDYHRVHMPVSGTLSQSVFVPGALFSVNRLSSKLIPHIYSRNERVITVFETRHGKVAIILIGALIVGSIKMIWQNQPFRLNRVKHEDAMSISLSQGDELGQFLLGSTVLILGEPGKLHWQAGLQAGNPTQVGQLLGKFS